MPDLADIQRQLRGLRALVQGQRIPSDAMWTLDETRVRLSHGINAKALSEEELDEWLEDDRTMSYGALRKLRDDELCPIRAISVSGDLKRIPEALCRRHLDEQQAESQPESLNQIHQ